MIIDDQSMILMSKKSWGNNLGSKIWICILRHELIILSKIY
jgi:hypothetical protein